ncbi:MAG: DUF423 domain-containing protein [Acidobacteriota bacterium]|nr:DUF423 domain-containing protein [Acidobacteriota bacterium]
MNWSAIGAGALALAVVLGAFGAHGLKGRVDDYAIGIWERAVFYHFIHALGLLVIPLFRIRRVNWVAVLLMIGILLFSGSLYVLVLSGVRMVGVVTPFGGLAFIAAWLLLAFELWRAKS